MVRSVKRYSDQLDEVGLPGRFEEHLLKDSADYRVWEYVVEHTYWVPRYQDYETYEKEIGEDGIPFVGIGDVPIHEFLQTLAGYNNAYFQLADYTKQVEHLLEVMREVQRERMWPVVLNSPAKLCGHGSHLSSHITPPPVFERYILPYYREFIPLLRQRGKAVSMHADADTSLILKHIESARWDMVECFVTAPMVPVTLEQARTAWGTRIIIWGGIPSILLSPNVAEQEFRTYIHRLFDIIAPGDAFILGVADNVMPDSLIERIAWVSDVVEQRGNYPIQ